MISFGAAAGIEIKMPLLLSNGVPRMQGRPGQDNSHRTHEQNWLNWNRTKEKSRWDQKSNDPSALLFLKKRNQ